MTSDSLNSRDHLFVSYASEDSSLAEWLTLRLTSEGFRVWCDRTKLLGGESYPLDIDSAIKNSTFRLIALLSKNSIHKPNPVKERTLALNIGRERKIDFLIPLNVDHLSSTELDWMTSDLTFIPFYESWAEGLKRLLKKLSQIQAPRKPAGGRQTVASWLAMEDTVVRKNEQLWSNVVPIIEIPEEIREYQVRGMSAASNWPFFQVRDHEDLVWAFGPPKTAPGSDFVERNRVSWRNSDTIDGTKTINIISGLLRQTMVAHCLKKGLQRSNDGKDIYFPGSLLKDDKLYFKRYDGKQVFIKVVGERSFRIAENATERSKYHLAPSFKPLMARFGIPAYELNLRILWTDILDSEYPRGKSNRRRRTLTKNWWNYEWLARIMAVISWITDGKHQCTLSSSEFGDVIMAGSTITTNSQVGIDEDAISVISSEDDETEVLEDLTDDENEDEEEVEGSDNDSK